MILAALATTIVVTVLFCIATAELLVGKPFFEQHRQTIAIVLGGAGIASLMLGMFFARRRGTGNSKEGGRIFVLLDLRYWGPMLALLGGLTLFVHSVGVEGLVEQVRGLLSKTNQVAAVAIPSRTNAPALAPVVTAPVSFPSVKVQGIILTKNRPMVILNGNSYGIGDRVGDAFVKEIQRDSVTLEKSNVVKTVFLGPPKSL